MGKMQGGPDAEARGRAPSPDRRTSSSWSAELAERWAVVVAFVIPTFFWGAVVVGGPIVAGLLKVGCYPLGATVGRS